MIQHDTLKTLRRWGCWLGLWVVMSTHAHKVVGDDWRYTIRPNDTISELARLHLKPSVKWETLAEYNRLTDPHVIQIGMQLRIPLHWLLNKQAQARLTTFSGDVQVQTLEGTWQAAQKNQQIQSGQSIKVGANSSARLHFADDSDLIMQPNTLVKLDTLSVYAGGYMVDTKLRLQAGRVEVNANPLKRREPKFEIITPSAVATVRGTQFVVEADADRTIEQTLQGLVAFQTSQGSVLVNQGFSSLARTGEKPSSPERTRSAPVLLNPVDRFIDFPIVFNWAAQADASGWNMQIGRDPDMSQLILSERISIPELKPSPLPNGNYYLRAWFVDTVGLPSQIAQTSFEVNIPRQLQGPAVLIQPQYFANGAVALQLQPLLDGKRYFLQLTQDIEGSVVVWQMTNANTTLTLPVPPQPNRSHYLWIWVY